MFINKIILIFCIVNFLIVTSDKCNKRHLKIDHIIKDKNKYFLEIEDKPDSYVPNELYTVILRVNYRLYKNAKFRKFVIFLEPIASANDPEDVSHQNGKLQKTSDLAIFSDKCKDTVIEANTMLKTYVALIWKAPPSNSGCVLIKAMVSETEGKWFADDEFADSGDLTITICENLNENEDVLPEVLENCCTCQDAKYEMIFEGSWIRNTHPKGFPEDVWTTRFSDIIGASHQFGYEFWKDGDTASDGLKHLADNDSTQLLEAELMQNISSIRTIIKSRGLAYPNITSSSYAIFKVDKENHLVSFVSKIIPSPDWIVGVSNMELCLSNCSWRQFRTVNLYPKDIGINDGIEYTSKGTASDNSVISEITLSNSLDPRSPFYSDNPEEEKLNPFAKIHFKLDKLYGKVCDESQTAEETTTMENEEENQE